MLELADEDDQRMIARWDTAPNLDYIRGLTQSDATSTLLTYESRMKFNIPLAIYSFNKMLADTSLQIEFITIDDSVFNDYTTVVKNLCKLHNMSAFLLADSGDDFVSFRNGGRITKIVPEIDDNRVEVCVKTASVINVVSKKHLSLKLRVRSPQDIPWYHTIRGF